METRYDLRPLVWIAAISLLSAAIGFGVIKNAESVSHGAGLDASSGLALADCAELCLAETHTLSSQYFGKWGQNPMRYYLVFMLAGTLFGGLCSALIANRVKFLVERGRRRSARLRAAFAFNGGMLVGFTSRLVNGCTSGQALTGTALLLTYSVVFLICIFVGGYATAGLFGRRWSD